MESNEIREQLRLAERAAAAPYIDYPKDPWWQFLLLSLVLPIFALLLNTLVNGSTTMRSLLALQSLAITGITLAVVLSQRKRRGALPSGGKAPAELRRVFRWYFVGASALTLAVSALALTTPLYVSMPVAWALSLFGIAWFGMAHERAAVRIRERLA